MSAALILAADRIRRQLAAEVPCHADRVAVLEVLLRIEHNTAAPAAPQLQPPAPLGGPRMMQVR